MKSWKTCHDGAASATTWRREKWRNRIHSLTAARLIGVVSAAKGEGSMSNTLRLKIVALSCGLAAVLAATAYAVTFGEPDGTRHPNVGALVVDWNPDSPGPDEFCTGTLVSPTLFLTAAHCMYGWDEGTEFWVTFSPTYDEDTAVPAELVFVSSFTIHEGFAQRVAAWRVAHTAAAGHATSLLARMDALIAKLEVR